MVPNKTDCKGCQHWQRRGEYCTVVGRACGLYDDCVAVDYSGVGLESLTPQLALVAAFVAAITIWWLI